MSSDDRQRVRELIDEADRIAVLTGAGISTDSGIPDFRGPQGLWTKDPDAEKVGRAFSNEVITPGVTTTDDVAWWLRQQVNDLGLGEWFPPSVTVQRPSAPQVPRPHTGHSSGRYAALTTRSEARQWRQA